MTLVEIVVVIALMGLVLAFAVPRLLAADAMGSDSQAKTTASGVLDAVVRGYSDDVGRLSWDPDAVAPVLGAVPDGQDVPGADHLPHLPVGPDVSKATLERLNPDIAVTPSTSQQAVVDTAPADKKAQVARKLPSTGVEIASTAALPRGAAPFADPTAPTQAELTAANANAYYAVGVAVYAPSGRSSANGSCWLVQRRMDAPAGPPVESYYLFDVTGTNASDTSLANPDADQCTGELAAALDYDTIAALADNAGSGADAGRSWGHPLTVTPAAVRAALTPLA